MVWWWYLKPNSNQSINQSIRKNKIKPNSYLNRMLLERLRYYGDHYLQDIDIRWFYRLRKKKQPKTLPSACPYFWVVNSGGGGRGSSGHVYVQPHQCLGGWVQSHRRFLWVLGSRCYRWPTKGEGTSPEGAWDFFHSPSVLSSGAVLTLWQQEKAPRFS